MGYFDIFKKKVRNPEKYVKDKKVGHKAVSEQEKKRKQLEEATKPPPSKLQKRKKKLGDELNRLKK